MSLMMHVCHIVPLLGSFGIENPFLGRFVMINWYPILYFHSNLLSCWFCSILIIDTNTNKSWINKIWHFQISNRGHAEMLAPWCPATLSVKFGCKLFRFQLFMSLCSFLLFTVIACSCTYKMAFWIGSIINKFQIFSLGLAGLLHITNFE